MSKLALIEKDHLKKEKDIPQFSVGDQVKIYIKVEEGDKTRTQIFAGTVIKKRGSGINSTFSVLKQIHGDTVEKVFQIHSPSLEKVAITQKGKVRRSKLYHLRNKKEI